MSTKVLKWGSVLFLVLALFLTTTTITAQKAFAASVVTYPQIPGMSVSGNFAVSVNGQSSPAYDAQGSPVPTYTSFSTDGAVTVDVQDLQGSVSSAVVRPKSYGITPTIVNGNTVEFTMNPLQKVSVEVNGDSTQHVALIFAHPLETTIPTGPNVVAYTTPGVYTLPSNPWCFPNGTDTLYIAGGVYLKGVINCSGVSHKTILGRGIFSGEGYTVPQYTSNVQFLTSDHTTIDGPTFVNWSQDSDGSSGYGFILDATTGTPSPAYNSLNDVAVINDPGTVNHTGLQGIGDNSTASNDFVIAGDDAAIVSDYLNNSTFTNLVLWTTDGDGIELGWNAGGVGNTVNGVDIIHYTGGNYAGTQAAIGAIAYCNSAAHPIQNVTVENVRVEGGLTRLFGIAAQNAGFCSDNPTQASISNITFSNITSEQNGSQSNVIFGSNSSATVSNINFQNLTIAGQQITNAAQGNFSLGAYTQDITFSGPHLQGVPAAVSSSSGALDVFVRGTDNNQWQRWYRGGSWSSGWANQGSPSGGLADSPAASATNGNDTTFVRGADGALWQTSWTGSSWSSWTSLGGPTNNTFLGVPAATSNASGALDVFVRGTDNNLWQRWYRNGSWSSSWANLGAPSGGLTDSPGAAALDGNNTIFAQGTDGTLWQISWTGSGWSSWTSLGGPN